MFEEVRKAIGANWFRAFVVGFGCLWVWHSFFSSIAEVGTARNVTAQGDNAATRELAIARGAVAEREIKEATSQEAVARQKAERESAEAEARIREATAMEALARQKAERESAQAEAKIRQATAQETLRRQKAEADEAEARAIKTKAEGCSARAKANAENMRIDMSKAQQQFTSGNFNFDPMAGVDPKAHFDLELMRDCDPAHSNMRSVTGNLRDAPCFRDLQAIFDKLPLELAKVEPILEQKITEWKSRCLLIDDQEVEMFNTIFHTWTNKPGLIPSQPSPTPSTISSKPRAQPAPPNSATSDDPEAEAVRQYQIAAEHGDAEAQVQLAYRYETGKSVLPKDLREAARLYRLAAEQGNASGQANLADFYERGDAGLHKNACEAERLRKLAAAQGNTYAQNALKEGRKCRVAGR